MVTAGPRIANGPVVVVRAAHAKVELRKFSAVAIPLKDHDLAPVMLDRRGRHHVLADHDVGARVVDVDVLVTLNEGTLFHSEVLPVGPKAGQLALGLFPPRMITFATVWGVSGITCGRCGGSVALQRGTPARLKGTGSQSREETRPIGHAAKRCEPRRAVETRWISASRWSSRASSAASGPHSALNESTLANGIRVEAAQGR